MKKITVVMLKEARACASQVRLFRKTFPNGATVTLANVIRADRAGLDVFWTAGHLLTGKSGKDFSRIEFKAVKALWKIDIAGRSSRVLGAACRVYRNALAKAFVAAWKMECAKAAK